MLFSEVQVGQKFSFNGETFTKTEPVKISCCKSACAVNVSTSVKIMVKPSDEVELVTE